MTATIRVCVSIMEENGRYLTADHAHAFLTRAYTEGAELVLGNVGNGLPGKRMLFGFLLLQGERKEHMIL